MRKKTKARPMLKRLSSAICAVALLAIMPPSPARAVEQAGKAGIVMEQGTRRVLAGYATHDRLPMASTTKVMTCLLALEYGNLGDTVTVGKNAVGVEGSSLYLKEGETLTLEDLLYGLMLRSGNDAAVAIAEHISGTVEAFVEKMNERAEELGAYDTNFKNPHGLHHDEHYTTAYDLALITAAAYDTPGFEAIVSAQSYRIAANSLSHARSVKTKNQLLGQYEGCDGVKIGYTTKAGRCFVASARRGGMRLICVVLNCYDMFGQSAALMDACFADYSLYQPAQEGQVLGQIEVQGGRPAQVDVTTRGLSLPVTREEMGLCRIVMEPEENLKAPLAAGDIAGQAVVYLGEERIASAPLIVAAPVRENSFAAWFKRIARGFLWTQSQAARSGCKNTSLPQG